MKIIIGITGGVGTGKSTVSHILEELYDARLLITDEIGHRAFAPNTNSYRDIVSHFGSRITDSEGNIIHSVLADIIFSDVQEKNYLDSIVHPYVFMTLEAQISKWRTAEEDVPLVIETALMFDTGCDRYCDEVWGVIADHDIRAKRLMENRGYMEDKVEAILKVQVSDTYLREKCDRIILNNGSEEELREACKL